VPVASEGASGEEPAGPCPAGSRARILVIDDDPTVLRVLRRMLGASHDVVTSRQAEHALRLIREQPEFDVIVCDVVMPEMDGVAFHREVSAKWPELAARIIFLSGGALAERGGEFFSSIPNAVLQKPPDATQLSRAIEHQLTTSGRAGRTGNDTAHG
jgi:CheY-like chemotaxis protein